MASRLFVRRALVRAVPKSFAQALAEIPAEIDVERARSQHAGYVAALRDAGVQVTELPPLDELPDSVFVEDPVVMLGAGALLTRPGAPSRQGEGEHLHAHLPEPIHEMDAPASLDGGDVLPFGDGFFVGLSSRTNAAGAARLSEVAERTVTTVPLEAGLHLKSLVTRVGDAVIGRFDDLDPAPFDGLARIDAPEPAGGNVLDLGDVVLVSAAAPATAALLTARGFAVRTVDLSEFHKADGALTCLSIRMSSTGPT